MSPKHSHDTHFTLCVKSLSRHIFGKTLNKESMLDRAIEYFNKQVSEASQDKKNQEKSDKLPIQSPKSLQRLTEYLNNEREERHAHLDMLCKSILELSEGENFNDSSRKSAQLLATVQLLSPTDGPKVALSNELNKPLYKAVMCLRLLDRLCMDNRINEPYVKERLANLSFKQYHQFSVVDPQGYKRFVDEVKIPLIKAALLQDIGNNHPDAQLILKGESGTENPFRMLEVESRKKLLQIDYRETVKYLVEGIGVAKYVGNSKEERIAFERSEQHKLLFIKMLLKGSVNPKQGIGNLLKVPQIYTSMILSTKPSYNYKLLPRVYQVLYQNADKGVCHREVVDAMYAITGIFPIGYGVTFIAENLYGELQERYEYAIVNRFYPPNPEEPHCRTATRNLSFISFGQDIVVSKNRNLYFPETSKKLEKISKNKLNDILELLSSNYIERRALDLIPKCWLANEYFSIKANQKLWNK